MNESINEFYQTINRGNCCKGRGCTICLNFSPYLYTNHNFDKHCFLHHQHGHGFAFSLLKVISSNLWWTDIPGRTLSWSTLWLQLWIFRIVSMMMMMMSGNISNYQIVQLMTGRQITLMLQQQVMRRHENWHNLTGPGLSGLMTVMMIKISTQHTNKRPWATQFCNIRWTRG